MARAPDAVGNAGKRGSDIFAYIHPELQVTFDASLRNVSIVPGKSTPLSVPSVIAGYGKPLAA